MIEPLTVIELDFSKINHLFKRVTFALAAFVSFYAKKPLISDS
jgi:hypothetical protein